MSRESPKRIHPWTSACARLEVPCQAVPWGDRVPALLHLEGGDECCRITRLLAVLTILGSDRNLTLDEVDRTAISEEWVDERTVVRRDWLEPGERVTVPFSLRVPPGAPFECANLWVTVRSGLWSCTLQEGVHIVPPVACAEAAEALCGLTGSTVRSWAVRRDWDRPLHGVRAQLVPLAACLPFLELRLELFPCAGGCEGELSVRPRPTGRLKLAAGWDRHPLRLQEGEPAETALRRLVEPYLIRAGATGALPIPAGPIVATGLPLPGSAPEDGGPP